MSMASALSLAKMRDAAPLFAALGDPTRLGLVVHLSTRGPESITSLSEPAKQAGSPKSLR